MNPSMRVVVSASVIALPLLSVLCLSLAGGVASGANPAGSEKETEDYKQALETIRARQVML